MSTSLRLIRKVGAAWAIIAGTLFVAAALGAAAIWLLRFSQGRGFSSLDLASRGLIEKLWWLMDRGAWLLALRWWLWASVLVGLLVSIARRFARWPSWRLALLWLPPFVIAVALAATFSDGHEIVRPPGGYLREPGTIEPTGDGKYILWPFLALGLQIVVTAVALLRSIRKRPTGGRWRVAQRVSVGAIIIAGAWMIALYENAGDRGYEGNRLYVVLPLIAIGVQVAVTAVAFGRSIREPSASGRRDTAKRQGVLALMVVGAWMIVYGSVVHQLS